MNSSKINDLIKKVLNKETVLYLVFGVLTTVVNFVVFYLCNKAFAGTDLMQNKILSAIFFGKPYLLSNTVAWLVSVIFAFFTNKIFVFESKSFKPRVMLRELISFFGARIFSLLAEQSGLLLLIDVLNLNELAAKIIMSVVVVILNYFFSKLFIFKKDTPDC